MFNQWSKYTHGLTLGERRRKDLHLIFSIMPFIQSNCTLSLATFSLLLLLDFGSLSYCKQTKCRSDTHLRVGYGIFQNTSEQKGRQKRHYLWQELKCYVMGYVAKVNIIFPHTLVSIIKYSSQSSTTLRRHPKSSDQNRFLSLIPVDCVYHEWNLSQN